MKNVEQLEDGTFFDKYHRSRVVAKVTKVPSVPNIKSKAELSVKADVDSLFLITSSIPQEKFCESYPPENRTFDKFCPSRIIPKNTKVTSFTMM
jgi:hypothetical protein